MIHFIFQNYNHEGWRKDHIRKLFQFSGPFILALSWRMALISSTLIMKTTRSPAICECRKLKVRVWQLWLSLSPRGHLTSMVQLLFNFDLLPCSNGIPSMNNGRLPSFAMKKSPLLRNLIVPCRRETLHAGPSSDRSTSMDS